MFVHSNLLIMKKIIIAILFLSFSFQSFSQDFKIPKDYVLETAEDFNKYEDEVVDCHNWLLKTPINEQTLKRKLASKFLLEWCIGTPSVSISIKSEIVTFMKSENSATYLLIFMGGWSKAALEKEKVDDYAGSLAGIESVIEFYKLNKKALGKDTNIEKYIKLQSKGTLKKYIKENA